MENVLFVKYREYPNCKKKKIDNIVLEYDITVVIKKKIRSCHLKNTPTNVFVASIYLGLDCLTRNSGRAAAIITNSLSRGFPRKRPQPGLLMAQSACSDNTMCGPTVARFPLQNFLLAQVPMEGALPRHRRDKTCAFALFLDAQVAK